MSILTSRYPARPLLRTIMVMISLCWSLTSLAQDSLKLYIFDSGEIVGMDPALFSFSADELAETDMVTTSYLIVHPQGTLMWEAGAVPDALVPDDGSAYDEYPFRVSRKLAPQLQEVGYQAADIDFFAMSHLHIDHNANANAFAGSTWIVQKADRDMMFSSAQVGVMDASQFSALEASETIVLEDENYDVFGDGSVQIISTPGHTPGHQVLLVNLPEHGPVILAGDLYHYPEEISTGRTPTFEHDPETTAMSRKKVEALMTSIGAEMWIGHDKLLHETLNYSPAYYE